MRRPTLLVLGLCVLVAGTLPARTAQADDSGRAPAAAERNIEEREVRAYAAAKREIEQLSRDWVPKMETVEPKERSALRKQFAAELLGRVRAAGLSMARYSEIQVAEQRDGSLRSRIARYREANR